MEEISIEVKDEDNISTLISTYLNIKKIQKEVSTQEEKVKNKIKIFLKEKQWKKYMEPNSKVSVSLVEGKTESFDKAMLKMILTDTQYSQVCRTTLYEKLMLITPEDKERLKKYVKTGLGGK